MFDIFLITLRLISNHGTTQFLGLVSFFSTNKEYEDFEERQSKGGEGPGGSSFP